MKKIAVFICAISMENQQKTMRGILEQARANGIVCYVFTCHINYMARLDSQEGAYNIIRLPDLRSFDGIILMKNTIQYSKIADELEERIKKSKVPCVSIDQAIDGMGNVVTGNYKAEFSALEYLIQKQNARTINFVAGYPGNFDSEERKRAYTDALEKYDIPYENDRLYYGNYSMESGAAAVEHWLIGGRDLPDAIVCANDQMAIGAIRRLEAEGVRIPQDVLVTGFDGEKICEVFEPRIATVYKHQDLCGVAAINLLMEQWNGRKPRTVSVDATFVPSESSGDLSGLNSDMSSIKKDYVSNNILIGQIGDHIRNMSSDLAAAESLEEFYETLKKNINAEYMGSWYLCMCDIEQLFYRENIENKNLLDLRNINTAYTEKLTIPVASHKGGITSFPEFYSERVLPPEVAENKDVDFFVISPLNYRNYCYGYFVTSNNQFALQSDLYYLWLANIAIALEHIRKLIIMRGLMRKLNDMWVFDTMTKLYNRAGFYNFAEDMLSDMKEKNANSFMLFIDLDGLKRINDTLGHEVGDAYICAMSEILKKEKQATDLVMRYGGDEFVVFGRCEDEEAAKELIARLKEDMKAYAFGDGSYVLEASIGLSFCPAREIDNIKLFIHDADERMYALKKARRKNV